MARRSLTRGVYGGVRILQRASSNARMLPTFLVVGAKRAGTSSLYRYLTAHPEVRPCVSGKGTHYFDVSFGRGWRWYRSSFPLAVRGGITGEASPYYMFHPLAPSRIAAALPDARLISCCVTRSSGPGRTTTTSGACRPSRSASRTPSGASQSGSRQIPRGGLVGAAHGQALRRGPARGPGTLPQDEPAERVIVLDEAASSRAARHRSQHRLLYCRMAFTDVLGMLAALLLALQIRFGWHWPAGDFLLVLGAAAVVTLPVYHGFGLYQTHQFFH